MDEVLAVGKGLTCSRTQKTNAVGASCSGVDSREMTLNKYQGQIMQILFDHVKDVILRVVFQVRCEMHQAGQYRIRLNFLFVLNCSNFCVKLVGKGSKGNRETS